MNSVRRLLVCLVLAASLLAVLPFSSIIQSQVYAQTGCSIGSINSQTGRIAVSGLNTSLSYFLRLNLQGNNTQGGQQQFSFNFSNPNTTQGNITIPSSVSDGEYFVTIIGMPKGSSLPPEQTGGYSDVCYFNDGDIFTLSRGNTITPPPGSGESCPTPGSSSLQAEPDRSWYWAGDPIVLSGNIFNCSSNILFDIFANNTTGGTAGNIPGTQDLSVSSNNQLRVSLAPLAKGEWEFNVIRNGGTERIFADNLVLNILNDKPELEGVPGSIAPGDQAEFTISSCPTPAEVRLDGERINEDAEVTRASATTVGVLIEGSFFEEEREYEVSATCAGRDADPKTITVEEPEEEAEPASCPVCPDSHRTYNRALGLCCSSTRCVGTIEDGNLREPDEDLCEGDIQACIPGRGCTELPGAGEPPCLNRNEDGTCEGVGFGDTALGLFLPTTAADFIRTLLGILLSVSGMIAVALIIRSGYQYMLSRGNPDALQEARDRLTSAIVGLLFIIFSLVILQVIGVDILGIPGIAP